MRRLLFKINALVTSGKNRYNIFVYLLHILLFLSVFFGFAKVDRFIITKKVLQNYPDWYIIIR